MTFLSGRPQAGDIIHWASASAPLPKLIYMGSIGFLTNFDNLPLVDVDA